MQSNQRDGQLDSGSDLSILDSDSDMSIDSEPGAALDIPDFALAWGSLPQVATPVRRPSRPPDPQLFHRDIDPQAIFEIDETQKDGSIETILVVPPLCTWCRSIRQACSRARPACTRCRKRGQNCKPVHKAYERLPGPKGSKGSNSRAKSTEATATDTSISGARESIKIRIRIPRTLSTRAASLSSVLQQPPPQVDTRAESSVATGSKRPLSPEQIAVRSRKKTQTGAAPRNSGEYRDISESSNNNSGSGALTWTFVDPTHEQDLSETLLDTVRSFAAIPRVWTSSLRGLIDVFPELDTAPIGLSWHQFETPLLLLEDTSANDHWTSSTGLCINMSWNFSCYGSDIETTVEPVVTPQHISHQSEAHREDSRLGDVIMGYETRTMTTNGGQPVLANGSSAAHAVNPASSLMVDAQGPPSNHAVVDHGDPQPNVPLVKPSEIEILIDSRIRHIPLLIWMSRNCKVAPSTPPAEYAYICMGFFFISDLRHTVTNYTICPISGVIRGQVCWDIKLEWAPGGEEALFEDDVDTSSDEQLTSDTRKDLSRPWWIKSTEASEEDITTPYRPRDLRMQFSTFLPLDLLADFHPSEFFPRGWFCSACGLLNIQTHFRHQICQSSSCRSASRELASQGKIDPLSSLRDLYQSQILLHPTDVTPSVLKYSEKTMWNDGMQSFTYGIKDKVTLCHVFTGNQESLQADANSLLETIQCEALLSSEGPSSPYFIHTTKFLHAADGSGTTVPVGTPPCVRTIYYTLRDSVERYGEMEKPAFGEVRIRAWTTSGSKRGLSLHATGSPVVILCLGAEAVLNFAPKGGYDAVIGPTAAGLREEKHEHEGSPSLEQSAGPPHPPEQDEGAESSLTVSTQTMVMEMPAVAKTTEQPASPATIEPHRSAAFEEVATPPPDSNAQPHTRGDVVVAPDHAGLKPKRGRQNKGKAKKASTPEISMTLVHGDSAILFGDDFECQIIRTGTSILVIGS